MFELVLRIGFSLLVVLGLLWGIARVVRRGGLTKHGSGPLEILDRQALSRGSSVAVVQVGDKALIVGVTDVQVSLLGETDLTAYRQETAHEHRDHLEVDPTDLEHPVHATVLPHHGGKLDGSVLSPRTWHSTLNFLRDRTSRH